MVKSAFDKIMAGIEDITASANLQEKGQNMTNKTVKPAKAVSTCNCDKRMKELETEVRELRDMVVYLAQNPHVKVDDYLKGASYV